MSCFPVRCFTCGKVVGHLYEKYVEMLKVEDSKMEDESEPKQIEAVKNLGVKGRIFDKLKIERYCCRRMFLGYQEVNFYK